MSTPVAAPDDLETYLGLEEGSIDFQRAKLFLLLAQNRCETIVSPCPAEAVGVVLAVAARAFSNPESVTSETIGPTTVQRAASSVTLWRDEKAFLRSLAGRTGAFSIDTMPLGTNAVQLVTVTATGGTFRLALSGQSTAPLAFNASSGAVAAALGALSLIGVGNIAVTGEGPYTVTFVNALKTTPIPTMTADGSALSGTGALVTVVTTTPGVFAPGQGLAPWDRDYLGQNTATGLDASQAF